MKTLNLVDLDKSDIKYKKIPFPDGQQNIIIDLKSFHNIEIFSLNYINNKVQIKSRLNNWLDLELIVCTVASLRALAVEEIHLYTPYIMGARSDRDFTEGNGGNNYLKDVICPIINSLNFKTVTCIDPHSDVLEACIKGFRKSDNELLTGFTLHGIYGNLSVKSNVDFNNFILVSPDAGASKKIYKLAEKIGYKGDVITCSKDRDNEGKLTKTIVPYEYSKHGNKDIIIIDDICDGGATFINIAKELPHERTKGKIYLIVTHGIFSKGFAELEQYFDGIYCTNSYLDKEDLTFEFGDITSKRQSIFVKEKLNQLNVF